MNVDDQCQVLLTNLRKNVANPRQVVTWKVYTICSTVLSAIYAIESVIASLKTTKNNENDACNLFAIANFSDMFNLCLNTFTKSFQQSTVIFSTFCFIRINIVRQMLFLLSLHVAPFQPGIHPPSHCPVNLSHTRVRLQFSLHRFTQLIPKKPALHSTMIGFSCFVLVCCCVLFFAICF